MPRDKYTLFVPPCSQSFEDDLEFALYYCPVTWSRRKAEYLGIYANKAVRAIGRIVRVVACDVDVEAGGVTAHEATRPALTTAEEQHILGASRRARGHGWEVTAGHKFYLCDNVLETDFRRTSGTPADPYPRARG